MRTLKTKTGIVKNPNLQVTFAKSRRRGDVFCSSFPFAYFSVVRPLLHCTIVDVVFHTNNNIIIEVVTDNYTKTKY